MLKHPLSLLTTFILGAVIFGAASIALAWTGPTQTAPNGNVSAPINVGNTDQVKNAGLSVNSLAVFGNALLSGASRYLNFGTTAGSSGYGIRDNAGTMEFKNNSGAWAAFGSGSGTGTIGGSGTASYLSRFTAGSTIGNSVIYDNGTNIGIGLTNPAAKLDVNGDIITNGSNTWMFHTPDDGRTTLYFGRGANGVIAEWPITFGAGGAATFGASISTPVFYDSNNAAYYVDPAAVSIMSDVRASVFYDLDNTGYYMNPNGTSIFNAVRASTFYDQDDATYYMNPAGLTILDTLRVSTITNGTGVVFNGDLQINNNVGIYGTIWIAKTGNGPIMEMNSHANVGIRFTPADNATTPLQFYNASNAVIGSITNTASGAAYNTTSDYRLKENVAPLTSALQRLSLLKPVRFDFKNDPSKTIDGFLAHEVTPAVPEAVIGEKDAVDDKGNPIYQQMDAAKLVPLLTAAIQELKVQNDNMYAEFKAYKVSHP